MDLYFSATRKKLAKANGFGFNFRKRYSKPMDLAFILYLKLKANGFGFYFLKRNPNPLDLDTFLMKSKFAILDFSFRQLKSRNPKPIQTFVARGADPRQ